MSNCNGMPGVRCLLQRDWDTRRTQVGARPRWASSKSLPPYQVTLLLSHKMKKNMVILNFWEKKIYPVTQISLPWRWLSFHLSPWTRILFVAGGAIAETNVRLPGWPGTIYGIREKWYRTLRRSSGDHWEGRVETRGKEQWRPLGKEK